MGIKKFLKKKAGKGAKYVTRKTVTKIAGKKAGKKAGKLAEKGARMATGYAYEKTKKELGV